MTLTEIVSFIGEVTVLSGILIPIIISIRKISDGTRCQLRSEMLRIYYNNKESETLRQYEYENFIILYEAYKTLKGNSFIDKIYAEIQKWDVIT